MSCKGFIHVLYADGTGWLSLCILNFRRAFSAYLPKVQLDHLQEPVVRRLTALWRFVVRELGSDLALVAMIPQHVLRRVFHSLIRIAPPHPTKPLHRRYGRLASGNRLDEPRLLIGALVHGGQPPLLSIFIAQTWQRCRQTARMSDDTEFKQQRERLSTDSAA